MTSITVIIVSLLVALTPVVGRFGNTATSRPVVTSPAVHTSDVVGGSPTVR